MNVVDDVVDSTHHDVYVVVVDRSHSMTIVNEIVDVFLFVDADCVDLSRTPIQQDPTGVDDVDVVIDCSNGNAIFFLENSIFK